MLGEYSFLYNTSWVLSCPQRKMPYPALRRSKGNSQEQAKKTGSGTDEETINKGIT